MAGTENFSEMAPPTFDVPRMKSCLKTQSLGRQVIYKAVTGTTMDDARRLAIDDNCPHGTIVLAERQTHGRGSKGHKWDSSNTDNLYLSLVLYLPQYYTTFEGRFSLQVAACLSVLQALHDLQISGVALWQYGKPVCKWPNDVWVRGRKLAGFLAEDGDYMRTNSAGEETSLLILGMGINVNADVRQSSELACLATSIYCELFGERTDREPFLATICNLLEERLTWPASALLEKFQAHNLFQRGMAVTVHDFQTNTYFGAVFSGVEHNWDVSLTDVPEHAGAVEGTVRGNSKRFSLRPCCDGTVFVWSGDADKDVCAQSLFHTLSALVDTSKYNVETINTEELKTDEWQSKASLLVVGDTRSLLNESATAEKDERTVVEKAVRRQLDRGQAVLAAGTAAQMLSTVLDPPVKTRPASLTLSDSNFVSFSILVRAFDPISSELTFRCQSDLHPVTFDLPPEGKVMASYSHDCNPAEPAVVVFESGQSGKACLCGFGIGQLRTALDDADAEKSAGESRKCGVQFEHVFRQDLLLTAMVTALLSEGI